MLTLFAVLGYNEHKSAPNHAWGSGNTLSAKPDAEEEENASLPNGNQELEEGGQELAQAMANHPAFAAAMQGAAVQNELDGDQPVGGEPIALPNAVDDGTFAQAQANLAAAKASGINHNHTTAWSKSSGNEQENLDKHNEKFYKDQWHQNHYGKSGDGVGMFAPPCACMCFLCLLLIAN